MALSLVLLLCDADTEWRCVENKTIYSISIYRMAYIMPSPNEASALSWRLCWMLALAKDRPVLPSTTEKLRERLEVVRGMAEVLKRKEMCSTS